MTFAGYRARRARPDGGLRRLRQLLDLRGRLADDSRSDGGGAAGGGDARSAAIPRSSSITKPACWFRRHARAVADGVLALAADPRRRQAMGDAGRWRVKRHFSIERMVEQYADFYLGSGGRMPLGLATHHEQRAAH